MKAYVPISMAMLVASLAVPEALGQHAQADLDHMPIFGMPTEKVDTKGTTDGSATTRIPDGRSLGIETRGLLEAHGVEVTQVEAGGPASKAGFKIGDIVPAPRHRLNWASGTLIPDNSCFGYLRQAAESPAFKLLSRQLCIRSLFRPTLP